MIVVAGGAPLKPGTDGRAKELIEEVVQATRAEPGCLSYTFYVEIADPNTIHVFEEWESAEALDSHLQRDHTQRFLANLGELLAGPPVVKRYDVTAVVSLL